MAPRTVTESLKGMMLASRVLEKLRFPTSPSSTQIRADIVQTLNLEEPERLEAFCRAIQQASPVDAFVCPVPSAMPGYDDAVVMASGSFVSGATIELSADGPMRPPYTAYMQGGLVYEQCKYALMLAVSHMELLTD